MAHNRDTGLVYIPSYQLPAVFGMPETPFEYQPRGFNIGASYFFTVDGLWGLDGELAKQFPPMTQLAAGQPDYTAHGVLKAWDPVKQQVVWEVDTSGPWRGELFSSWNGGGLMTTASGLLVQGRGTGELALLDADTGKTLHSLNVGTSMMASPMTYRIDGEQYIAIMAGLGGAFGKDYPPGSAAYDYGNQGRIIAFKLGGGDVPRPAKRDLQASQQVPMPPPLPSTSDKEIALGGTLFQRHCAVCHANTSGGSIPDLRKMSSQTHGEFMDILLKGTRVDKGMGNFSAVLNADQAQAIHRYVHDLAWKAYVDSKQAPGSHKPDSKPAHD
jgi:quinohemoprotein ethanol dehydrogenase